VPPSIRLGQGVRGGGQGGGAARCGWRRNVAWRGNPRPAATGAFYRAAAAWGDGGVSFARWIGGRGGGVCQRVLERGGPGGR
jgi:hypothetical protein